MKQLHRQASMSKQHRPHHHRASLSRTLASYLLREQRFLFVLLGFLLASSFFFLYPSSVSPHSAAGSSSATNFAAAVARKIPRGGASSAARRLPVGVRKPSLRVVVTGGAGFVGSHLVDKLLARGDSVIVVDNFFTGRKDNVAHHLGNPRFELVRHDVVEPILLEVDQIYHLACPSALHPPCTTNSTPSRPSYPTRTQFVHILTEMGSIIFVFIDLFMDTDTS
jgi:UDP-glucuronate decarboxylase